MMKKLLLIAFFAIGLCTVNAQITISPPQFAVGDLMYASNTAGNGFVVIERVNRTPDPDPVSPAMVIEEDIVVPTSITTPVEITFSSTAMPPPALPATIPAGTVLPVVAIGNRAFRRDDGLTSIVIPNGISFSGGNHFQEARGLTSISLPEDIGILPQAFIQQTQLTTLTIPEGATGIAGSGSFHINGNTLLTELILPTTLTRLGESSISGNPALTSITLPENLTTYINNNGRSRVFNGTNNLETITVLNPVPATVLDDTFQDAIETGATLIVPDGTVAAYEAAPFWDFATIISATDALSITTVNGIKGAAIDASNGQISVTGATLDAVYTISGQRINEAVNLPVGIYIVKISEGNKEEVVKVILN